MKVIRYRRECFIEERHTTTLIEEFYLPQYEIGFNFTGTLMGRLRMFRMSWKIYSRLGLVKLGEGEIKDTTVGKMLFHLQANTSDLVTLRKLSDEVEDELLNTGVKPLEYEKVAQA